MWSAGDVRAHRLDFTQRKGVTIRMADSGRSQDRDDEVSDPQHQDENLGNAGRNEEVADSRDRQEPDRGIAPWQSWVRLATEVILPFANQIMDLINGSGG
jgi:hypothetical protein